MTKKQQKIENRKNRVMVLFNCGERYHKSAKDYDRKKFKKIVDFE